MAMAKLVVVDLFPVAKAKLVVVAQSAAVVVQLVVLVAHILKQ